MSAKSGSTLQAAWVLPSTSWHKRAVAAGYAHAHACRKQATVLQEAERAHLICCDSIRLHVRVVAPRAAAFAVQGRPLTADGAAH